MFYIYILHSTKADKYYIGYSNDPFRRVEQHNTADTYSFTAKFRPWKLKAVFKCCDSESEAIQLERFIKNQKSRKLIEKLCLQDFVPNGKLA